MLDNLSRDDIQNTNVLKPTTIFVIIIQSFLWVNNVITLTKYAPIKKIISGSGFSLKRIAQVAIIDQINQFESSFFLFIIVYV